MDRIQFFVLDRCFWQEVSFRLRHRLKIEILIFTEGKVRGVEPKEDVDKRRVYEGKMGLFEGGFEVRC